MTEDGEDLGTIADVYFDERSGRVTGYEVSGGRIDDMVHGSSYLPFEAIRTIGADAVITDAAARGVVERPEHTDTGEDATAGQEGGPGTSDDVTANDPDGSLVGARAQRDLLDRDGSVVIASGQVVTPELVERARAEGNLDPLYGAVGRARPAPGGDSPDATAQAPDTAADLWGRFTARLSEMTDAAGQRLDAQQTKAQLDRINDSIGRPVTKVMLDRDDSVILDLGDLVTHQAVQRADDAGLLGSLLASVYKADDVTFSRDELRARIEGDSTVEKASGGASVVDDLEARLAAPADTGDDGGGDQGAGAEAGESKSGEGTRDGSPSNGGGGTKGTERETGRLPVAAGPAIGEGQGDGANGDQPR